ncbi:MAG: hypothetical protein M3Z35_07280 [Nitrospirota bacterium]|nr:hypothetical protein [Nitrospirota bacterium]
MTSAADRLFLEAQTAILEDKQAQFRALQAAGRNAAAMQKGMEVMIAAATVLRMSNGLLQQSVDLLRQGNAPPPEEP